MADWISVDERLPKSGELVLVWSRGLGRELATYTTEYNNEHWYGMGGPGDWLTVTRWMPLPDPPQTAEER